MRPSKPAAGMPCNGCGLCCRMEVCAIGALAYPDAVAPCPALRRSGDMFRCALVEMERSMALEPVFAKALGIGQGCDSYDPGYTGRSALQGQES